MTVTLTTHCPTTKRVVRWVRVQFKRSHWVKPHEMSLDLTGPYSSDFHIRSETRCLHRLGATLFPKRRGFIEAIASYGIFELAAYNNPKCRESLTPSSYKRLHTARSSYAVAHTARLQHHSTRKYKGLPGYDGYKRLATDLAVKKSKYSQA